MNLKYYRVTLFFFLISFLPNTFSFASNYVMHGVTIDDPYSYLEDMDSVQTGAFLDVQTLYANNYFDHLTSRSKIKKSLEQNFYFDAYGIPKEIPGGLVYFYKDKDEDKVSLCFENKKGEREVLVDPKSFEAGENTSIIGNVISPNQKYLCFGLSDSGSDFTTFHFYDLDRRVLLDQSITDNKFTMPLWSRDSKGVYYSRWKKNDFSSVDQCLAIYYHSIDDHTEDIEVLDITGYGFDLFTPTAIVGSEKYLLITTSVCWDKNGILLYNLEDKSVKELVKPDLALYEFLEEKENLLYFRTNKDAPNKKVIALHLKNIDINSSHEVIPESQNELTQVSFTKNYLICHYIEDCKSKIVFYNESNNFAGELPLDDMGSVRIGEADKDEKVFQEDRIYFVFSNFTTPTSVFHYDLTQDELSLFYRPFGKNHRYVTRQVFFSSKDGTKIPMFITYKKNVKLNGNNPTLMYGYGGFAVPLLPHYSTFAITWLQMGGIYVSVNLRGGSEYGSAWHDAGRLQNKQNVFDDFIAAGEWLIENRYTKSEKLAINGGSNGGLLVGACVVQRPELFGAAVAQVGVLDMLKFHKYTIGKTWISDYGDPDDPEDFKILYSYSPYHNVEMAKKYPATLITTADHDDRVVPLHSYKFFAKLNEAQSGDREIILRVNRKEGHGGGGGSYNKIIEGYTDILSFLSKELKMDKNNLD